MNTEVYHATHAVLPISAIVQQVDIAINLRERHLGRVSVFGPSSCAGLMHQTDTRDMTLGRVSAIESGLVDGFFIRVNAQLDHAKRDGAANEDISAAVFEVLAVDE